MLQPRLCHIRDDRQATDDDQSTYVIGAGVTHPQGVTSSKPIGRSGEGIGTTHNWPILPSGYRLLAPGFFLQMCRICRIPFSSH